MGEVRETRSSGHPRIATALLILGTLLAFLAIFSIWANRQALNTDNWVDTSERLLQNEEVESRLSNYVAEQLFANVDVRGELEATLPPRLQPLASAAAGGLQQLVPQVTERALDNPKFEQLWADANRAAHERLLRILDGGDSAVSTDNGEVKLDLSQLIARIAEQTGVGGDVVAKIPKGAGEITILESDQLSLAQDGTDVVRGLPVVLTLLVLLLYGAAIYLAGPRRRRALRSVGFGFIVAGLLALIVRTLAGNVLVGELAKTDSVEPAIEAVWSIGTSLLVTVAVSAIAFGVLVVIGAWLAGPTASATALRRWASPYVREQRALAWAAAVVVFLVLVAWAPIAAFQKPLGILVFALLLGLATELLLRQTLREFPDSERGEAGAGLRERWTPRPAAAAPPPVPASETDQLERLSALRHAGDLSDEEFAAAKARILSGG